MSLSFPSLLPSSFPLPDFCAVRRGQWSTSEPEEFETSIIRDHPPITPSPLLVAPSKWWIRISGDETEQRAERRVVDNHA